METPPFWKRRRRKVKRIPKTKLKQSVINLFTVKYNIRIFLVFWRCNWNNFKTDISKWIPIYGKWAILIFVLLSSVLKKLFEGLKCRFIRKLNRMFKNHGFCIRRDIWWNKTVDLSELICKSLKTWKINIKG